MARVISYVYVMVGGAAKLLRPGDTVPDGVTVTNPDVLEADAKTLPASAPEQKAAESPAPEAEPVKAPAKRTSRKSTTDS